MFKQLLFASLLALTYGFAAFRYDGSTTALAAMKSRAIPFLDAPEKLDGTAVGDYGFDPMGLTYTIESMNFVQSAELKHGRVAMLACLGFLVQQKVHFLSPESDPIRGMLSLGLGPNLQILSFIGVIELMTWEQTYTGSAPAGDFGFDPLGLSKNKSKKDVDTLKLKEVKNGRLAMIGIMGMLAQSLATKGQPLF